MSSFVKGPNYRTPFGRNEFLRSTQDIKTESYTVSAEVVPEETIDDHTQKVLQTGEVLARITSGPDEGKVGPFQDGALDGRGIEANIVGLNNTFLPWQLMERDVEVAVIYECTAVQEWCFTRDAAGARIELADLIADEMRGKKRLDIMFA